MHFHGWRDEFQANLPRLDTPEAFQPSSSLVPRVVLERSSVVPGAAMRTFSGLDEIYFRRFRDTWTLNCMTNSNVHSIGFCFDFLVFGVFAQAKSHGGEMFLQSFEALNGQP